MPIEKVHELTMPDAAGIADLVQRATVAWLQTGVRNCQPMPAASSSTKGWGMQCCTALWGFWRCTGCGPITLMLRRIKRWPKGVEK